LAAVQVSLEEQKILGANGAWNEWHLIRPKS